MGALFYDYQAKCFWMAQANFLLRYVDMIVNFIIQKLKNKHTFLKKYTNWAKLSSLILTEQEETKTRYFAPYFYPTFGGWPCTYINYVKFDWPGQKKVVRHVRELAGPNEVLRSGFGRHLNRVIHGLKTETGWESDDWARWGGYLMKMLK